MTFPALRGKTKHKHVRATMTDIPDTIKLDTSKLAAALRQHADSLAAAGSLDTVDLIRVLARICEGKTLPRLSAPQATGATALP